VCSLLINDFRQKYFYYFNIQESRISFEKKKLRQKRRNFEEKKDEKFDKLALNCTA
jgi:hypothetical protein